MKTLAILALLLGATAACAEPLTATRPATLHEALADIMLAALNRGCIYSASP